MDRVIAALNYYHILFITPLPEKYGKDPEALFEAFVEDLYSRRKMLEDYIHWVLHHKDPESLLDIRKQLQIMCDRVKHCRAAARHYRDRRNDGNGAEGTESKWFHEIMDSIHFNVYHLNECGLRVSLETVMAQNDGEEQDESILFDRGLKMMAKELESKQNNFRTERLDGIENAKFTLKVSGQNISEHVTGSDNGHGL